MEIKYKCSKCGIEDVKLWRQYSTFLNHIKLLCVDCALRDQNVNYEVGENGTHFDCDLRKEFNSIEWLVPAVPTTDNTFWGYTSVPEKDALWWKDLPLRQQNMVGKRRTRMYDLTHQVAAAHILLTKYNIARLDSDGNEILLYDRIKILAEQTHINSEMNANVVNGTITGIVIENLG